MNIIIYLISIIITIGSSDAISSDMVDIYSKY